MGWLCKREKIFDVRKPLTSILGHFIHCLHDYRLSLVGSRGPQFSGLASHIRVSPPVGVIILFTYVIDWPRRTIFQTLPASKNSRQRGRLSVGMSETYSSHLNLFWFSARFKDRTLVTRQILRSNFTNTTKAKVFKYWKSLHICSQWPCFGAIDAYTGSWDLQTNLTLTP